MMQRSFPGVFRVALQIAMSLISCVSLAEVNEIYCSIRASGMSLDCQIMGKDKKVMSAEDIGNFIDQGQNLAYIVLKSRRSLERVYKIDRNAPQYKKLAETKKNSSISEISRAKADLFAEIEKKIIKLSDDLDAREASAELILFDSSIGYEKMKREQRDMVAELENFRKSKDQVCTSTKGFEQITKANNSLQQVLSDILVSFSTPGTCLASYRINKDADGAVDLRQLSDVPEKYKLNCRK